MNGPDDPLSRLGGSPAGGEDFLASLPSRLAERLGGEAPFLRHDDDRTVWLVLEGTDVIRFDPEVAASLSAGDRERMIAGFAELLSRFRLERDLLDGVAVGDRIRIDVKDKRLRRTFRHTGTVVERSDYRPAVGLEPGGWTLELEIKPRFGSATTMRVDSARLVAVQRR
jgi:hypothetical protein